MKNRFNNLTSKEWLPFQKSWFKYSNREKLYHENVRFFMKFDDKENPPNLVYVGDVTGKEIITKIAKKEKAKLFFENDVQKVDKIQFVLFDYLKTIDMINSVEEYKETKSQMLQTLSSLNNKIFHRKFIAIFIKNKEMSGKYFPFAWDLAKNLSCAFSLKDEKIGCLETSNQINNPDFFQTDESVFYSLYFRNDENSQHNFEVTDFGYFENNKQINSNFNSQYKLNSWHILKPKPRNKDEILHPAKFPEELIELFLPHFTKEFDNVFDPMCGTGSTILCSLQNNRNGYGIELSDFFFKIANERNKNYLESNDSKIKNLKIKFLCKDARKINKTDFPLFDYIITSPPYWDMLNMKGAEGQARRKEKGLQLNYSDDTFDLGNIDEFDAFLDELVKIYFKIITCLKPGGHFTIVVKNIKKKGKNYPFAWDLSRRLQEKMILLPEVFWLQDDIRIAPYGYFNTWVSNTFHQYCLTFQKP
jgi:DNA modification methylase